MDDEMDPAPHCFSQQQAQALDAENRVMRAEIRRLSAVPRFKANNKRVRLIFTDSPGGVMPEHKGKVFAIIGPFDSFTDKTDLQEAIEMLIRGHNLEPPDGTK